MRKEIFSISKTLNKKKFKMKFIAFLFKFNLVSKLSNANSS